MGPQFAICGDYEASMQLPSEVNKWEWCKLIVFELEPACARKKQQVAKCCTYTLVGKCESDKNLANHDCFIQNWLLKTILVW